MPNDEVAQLKAEMMKKAEAAIDKLLAEKQPAERISLNEIETLAIRAGQTFREEILRSLVGESEQAAEEQQVRPSCAKCGKAMHHKGKRRKQVVTEAGEMTVYRDYYYCQTCGVGIFPPG